ncbi:MAG: right-handed parallel beta-helix repeat-containing protein, partial [Candidatus Binatia bacterium]
MRGALCGIAGLGLTAAAAFAQPVCPGTATLTVFAENLSTSAAVDVTLDGALAASAATCLGGDATSYQGTLTCTGSGTVRCGQVTGLQPGAWVHRLALTVPDSDPQQQAQRMVLVAGPTGVSNAIVWTIYPRAFVVPDPGEASLRAQLDAAAAYTAANPGPALVTFAAPQTIDLSRGTCDPDPSRRAALCFTGSRVVVDALDANGEPGSVVWSVGTRDLSLLRLYGSDNVLRGLVFAGSQNPDLTTQVDTLAITGATARRNRIEQSLVVGPLFGSSSNPANSGDAVSIDDGAADNLIVDSRITGAEDRGIKINDGVASVARSCVHDNRNGGILATSGGHATAIENVVQRNVPGTSQNGLTVLGTDDRRSTLITQGNVVRFSGARGVSVTDNAEALLNDDYVADSQIRGSTVDTTSGVPTDAVGAELPPAARFHGVALVCNRREDLTGSCDPPPGNAPKAPCAPASTATDCCTQADGTIDATCAATTTCNPSDPGRFGAMTFAASGHAAPDVSYGDALQPGRNAFTNSAKDPTDANFGVEGIATTVPARGNQWESCATGAPCDVTPDISPPDALVDVGVVADPHATNGFHITRTSPPRPRA